jgi:hypothetical protein
MYLAVNLSQSVLCLLFSRGGKHNVGSDFAGFGIFSLVRQKLQRKINIGNFFRTVAVENMKIDHFIIYITTTHPTELHRI